MSSLAATDDLQAIRLSSVAESDRVRLLEAYRTQVYEPAFPEAEIRENPRYWLDLLGSSPYPPPPQPQIEGVLLADGETIVAGVTIEHYRTARSGLLTYISVAPQWRGRGIGRRLVRAARDALDAMADADTPMFAETEPLEDAASPPEAAETLLRQKRLAGLGARLVAFDYVMPPLRPDSAPHRLHLMLIDPHQRWTTVEASRVVALMRELAAALGADLAASPETAGMMEALAAADTLALQPLPAVQDATR